MNGDCVFCKIYNKEIRSDVLWETENFFVIRDANPKVEGHSLVISKKHFENFLDLPSVLGSELIEIIKRVSFNSMKDFNSNGFNLVQNNGKFAGQVVNHLHFHILPRKEGDGFSLI